jgi:polar amino acid transport system substrate-binding protein
MSKGLWASLLVGMWLWPGASAAEPLKLVTIDTAPWAYNEGGRPKGVFVDIVNEIARRTGLEMAIALHPFARIPRELEAGRQDCTILLWVEDWAPFMVAGEEVSTHVFGIVARKGLTLRGLDDLAGRPVSMLRGLSLGPQFDNDTRMVRQFDTDYAQGLRKLAHGRVDAVAGALPTIHYLARTAGLTDALGTELTQTELSLKFQCTKASRQQARMAPINDAIRAMRADGAIERIKAGWAYY